MSIQAPTDQHPADDSLPTEFTEDSAAAAIDSLLSDEEDSPAPEARKAPRRKTPEPNEGDEPEDGEEEDGDEGEDEEESEEDRADDDESESEDAEESDDADDTNLLSARVKVGEEEVTVEEAVKGYMRTKDYTQKTQALADEKKQTLAARQQILAAREQHVQRLAELDAIVNALVPEPNWQEIAAEGDDGKLARAYIEHQQRQQKLAELRQEQQDVLAAYQEDQRAILSEKITEEREALLKAIPEWQDATVRKAEKAKIAAFAESLGLGEDLKSLVDHRVFLLVRDAMKYRELQSKKPAVKANVEKVKVVRAGPQRSERREVTQVTRQKQRFAKTHRVDDAARLIEMIEFPE